MKPKKKAEDLILKFSILNEHQNELVKQCALICVNEMIAHNPTYPNTADWDECGGSHKYFYEAKMETAEKYWKEVKQEIENFSN